jgi:thymidylate synthase
MRKKEVELAAHKRTEAFLNSKADTLSEEAINWHQKYMTEIEEIDSKITTLNDKRTRAKQRLKELEEYVAHQEMSQRHHEEEEAKIAEEKRRKRAAEQRKLDSLETIWDILREFKDMPRKAPRRGGKKKKK